MMLFRRIPEKVQTIFHGLTATLMLMSLSVLTMPQCQAQTTKTVDLELNGSWDMTTVQENPHKGWYHHYYDDGGWRYLTKADSDLDNFPGMHHIYMRLPWSKLEPQNGVYDWSLIDNVINKWGPKGYTFSFRVTCKETDLYWATPEWVKNAGGGGKEVTAPWGPKAWQPDYADPEFLYYLERFHQQFANRYASRGDVEYIDVGSYGDWGEGHHYGSSGNGNTTSHTLATVKEHINIYKRKYPSKLLMISDDFVTDRPGSQTSGEQKEIADFIVNNGLTFRDDSINVRYYVDTYPSTYSVRSPWLFQRVYDSKPTLLEQDHYQNCLNAATWTKPNGVTAGRSVLENAIRLTRATYVGFHGYADTFLQDNPVVARELYNIMGYWYFLKTAVVPTSHKRGTAQDYKFTWLNRGAAKCYYPYRVRVRFEGNGKTYTFTAPTSSSNNRNWQPGVTFLENYRITLPTTLTAGTYTVKVRIIEDLPSPTPDRNIKLGLKNPDANGFYPVTTISVTN